MPTTYTNYLANLLALIARRRILRPLVISYYATAYCNLNCTYCEDFGLRRNALQPAPLSLEDARRLLRIIRRATDSLVITGGEPLLYPHLDALLTYARNTLHFRSLTVLTNAARLHERWNVLQPITRLMVSLDTLDLTRRAATWGTTTTTAQRIEANIIEAARRQQTAAFRLVVNCVVTPETLAQAEDVLTFCLEHGALFSFSPQSANNWPRYALLVSQPYRDFVDRLITLKRAGGPILGSLAYLRTVRDFMPYACYPMLAPRVLVDGSLAYPCRPIEREGDAHGGHAVNLLRAGSWREAIRQAVQRYGLPPSTCGSCYQQCYIEPSLMQARPWDLLWELMRYPPSRRGEIVTYVPG